MAVQVAVAMLHRDGRWLLGTVWRYLDPGETHEQALQRELLEEISWQPPAMELVMVHNIHRRTATRRPGRHKLFGAWLREQG